MSWAQQIRLASGCWTLALAGILTAPLFIHHTDVGDDLTRNTVRLALAYWAVAAALMLYLRPQEWSAVKRGKLARVCWTLAWAAYVIHVAMAFHFYHHWSHEHAIEHTQEVSGFGPGIYFSHLFTLLWTADVLWWWVWPNAYARRSAWIGRTLHPFMVFIIFNGTVVYETGPIRYAGLATSLALGGMCLQVYLNRIFGIEQERKELSLHR